MLRCSITPFVSVQHTTGYKTCGSMTVWKRGGQRHKKCDFSRFSLNQSMSLFKLNTMSERREQKKMQNNNNVHQQTRKWLWLYDHKDPERIGAQGTVWPCGRVEKDSKPAVRTAWMTEIRGLGRIYEKWGILIYNKSWSKKPEEGNIFSLSLNAWVIFICCDWR